MFLTNIAIIPKCPNCSSEKYQFSSKVNKCLCCGFTHIESDKDQTPSAFSWYAKEIEELMDRVM